MSSDDEAIVGGRTYKRPRQVEEAHPSQKQKRKKHLYLVLDDWHEGFTIRKLDADDIPGDLLSAPPVVRLLSPAYSDSMTFAALGSHILATNNQHPATLVYDTATAGLAAGPSLPDPLLDAFNIFVPAAGGDTLYAVAYYFMLRRQRVEVMSARPGSPRGGSLETTTIPTRDWSWRSLGPPSPFAKEERVWSYAAHPEGRTVFMSAGSSNGGYRTFSFGTAAGDVTEWRCHGDWTLPFEGQGYFDSDLDAWVGLDEDGHIGTCQVPSTNVQEQQQQPPELDWKTAKDKLWDERRQVALRPTLTSMGNARFCLVDCVKPVKDDGWSVLRVTTFRLRHSRKGELQIFDRSTSSCPVDKHTSFAPVAFWM